MSDPLGSMVASAGPVSVDGMLAGLESLVVKATEFMEPGLARDYVNEAVVRLRIARERNTQGAAMYQAGPGHWGPYGPTANTRPNDEIHPR